MIPIWLVYCDPKQNRGATRCRTVILCGKVMLNNCVSMSFNAAYNTLSVLCSQKAIWIHGSACCGWARGVLHTLLKNNSFFNFLKTKTVKLYCIDLIVLRCANLQKTCKSLLKYTQFAYFSIFQFPDCLRDVLNFDKIESSQGRSDFFRNFKAIWWKFILFSKVMNVPDRLFFATLCREYRLSWIEFRT